MLRSLRNKFILAKQIANAANNNGTGGHTVGRRFLNVHEYVAMEILQKGGVKVPRFGVASTPDEAVEISKRLGENDFVVKAQVLTGGRGRGHFSSGLKGGVKLVYTAEEVREVASKMLGKCFARLLVCSIRLIFFFFCFVV